MKISTYHKKKFKFHLHGFSRKDSFSASASITGLNSTYMDLVPIPDRLKARVIKAFKFHLHGFSLEIVTSINEEDTNEFKFHLHEFSLVTFFILIFQCFLYWFLSISSFYSIFSLTSFCLFSTSHIFQFLFLSIPYSFYIIVERQSLTLIIIPHSINIIILKNPISSIPTNIFLQNFYIFKLLKIICHNKKSPIR